MTEPLRMRGRDVGAAQLAQIRAWLGEHPDWSRRRLSQELARHWDWRTPTGQLNLGYPDGLGQLHYLVRDRQGQDVAVLLFGPAAWKVAARDAFIGWSVSQRQRRLAQLANNSRFLILPSRQTPHLASHLLAQALYHLRRDWLARHGVPLLLVETFVDAERFAGTCYRAANWIAGGQTQGRTRNDRHHRRRAPRKTVYLRPLSVRFRECLCAPLPS